MLQLTRDTDLSVFVIKSYESHQMMVNDTIYRESILLTANSIKKWPPNHWANITVEDIRELTHESSEVVLIGTGEQQHFLSDDILLPLIQKNIGFEIMNTLSACRTYRVLASEGRAVVAGFIL